MKYLLQKKSYILITFILVLIGTGIFFLIGKKQLNSKIKEESVAGIIHQVSILKDRAEPNELIIKVNEKVQFNSKDGKSHDIALGRGNDYGMKHEHVGGDSGNFAADEGYLVSFNKVGTYYFHDDYNPNIFITILVY